MHRYYKNPEDVLVTFSEEIDSICKIVSLDISLQLRLTMLEGPGWGQDEARVETGAGHGVSTVSYRHNFLKISHILVLL